MSDRLDPEPVDALVRLARARRSAELLDVVRVQFGGSVTLFAADHAFDELIDVGGSRPPVPLVGALRSAILRSEPVEVDGATWTPLPERGRSVFVLHEAGPVGSLRTLWGQSLFDHLGRFEELERQRRRKNMDVAAELQHDLLPVGSDYLGDWSVGGVLEPAYSVAGDLFDHAYTDGRVWAYSFDGMGHGLDATLPGVLAVTAVRNARRAGASLADQMGAASAVLYGQYGGDLFVTAVGCCISDGGVEFVNAGHEPVREVVARRARALDLDADLPLGVVGDLSYRTQRRDTPAIGDGFALYSDGPTLARSSAGEEYGAHRLDRSTEANWTDSAMSSAYGVLDDLRAFVGDAAIADDITAVILRRER